MVTNLGKQFVRLTKTLTLAFFRNRQAMFFVLILPLIFMFIFGFLYGGGGERVFTVAFYLDESAEEGGELWQEIINQREGLTYQLVEAREKGEELVRNLEADVFLVREGNSLEAFYHPARLEDNPELQQQVEAVAAEYDREQTGLLDIMAVEKAALEGADGSVSPLEFMFPGLIALGLASSGLFVFAEAFLDYRKKGVLKRMVASPMSKTVFILALMTSRFPPALFSSVVVLLMGYLFFGVTFSINWLAFLLYLVVGLVVMMGFGALITLIARTKESASQVASVFLITMLFFSGIYFPVEFLPVYFQRISVVLPLSYLARGLRFIMGLENLAGSLFILETLGLFAASLAVIILLVNISDWAKEV